MSRLRVLPAGFVPPCLPSGSKAPPSGKEWLHEIKHDGFRVIARKIGKRVRLYSRPGNDLTKRFPPCGTDGIACFDLIRDWEVDDGVFMYAFDLIELSGEDMRGEMLESRRATLDVLLGGSGAGIRSSTSRRTAQPCSRPPASSGSKVSSRSARTRVTFQAARRTGSNRTIRTRRR